jgi:N4-(beta-N-acetylglucosaminyl)-L-asparaginase
MGSRRPRRVSLSMFQSQRPRSQESVVSEKVSRRKFVISGAAIVAAGASAGQSQETPRVATRGLKPVVISAANGNHFKNGGKVTCVEKAFALITDGADVLDAVIAGVNILELDPEETSIGYGGLPNADGVVQLDASVMHGPKKRAGAVAALEGVRTPSLVAKAVMENTDHHLLVGQGAQTFARNMGFTIEPDLNTEKSRKLWLEWKRRADPAHYLDPKSRSDAGRAATWKMAEEGLIDINHVTGTINCNGINAKGEICGVTTTSGLAFKIPGRVGDSPILGAGLYVDGSVGAAGSTGRGEANLYGLCSFLIVEFLRQGLHPKDAAIEVCKRIKSNTIEKRLLDRRGNPNFDVTFYVLDTKGRHAGVSLLSGAKYAVCTENGPETLHCEALIERKPGG